MHSNTQTAKILALNPSGSGNFEHAAGKAREIGATHVLITEDLFAALWQMGSGEDPYPAWYLHQPGLLKIFPPDLIKPYVDQHHAESVASILEERCSILRTLGLKAYYCTNEPQVLSDAFFRDHPVLRGPRVDQPNRSRRPHFAPCTDRPEVRDLYRQSLQLLFQRCPEVSLFSLLTTDSGSGFCWAPGLYPGRNGPPECETIPMSDRVSTFLGTLKAAAEENGREIEVHLVEIPPRRWMAPTFEEPEGIARRLPRGLAVNNREGPDGRPFISGTGLETLWGNSFYPLIGIPRPVAFLRNLAASYRREAPRKVLAFTDSHNNDLNFSLAYEFGAAHAINRLEQMALLRKTACRIAGEESADPLLELWLTIDDIETLLEPLDFGPILRMGCVLARWINRPFVPFPEELVSAESAYWRAFLFQAKGDEQVYDLADIQGMRMFSGWGARMLVERTVERILDRLETSFTLAEAAGQWETLTRLKALRCLIRTCRNAVAYQAQLDRVNEAAVPPDPNPVLGTKSSWARNDLLRIAREEINNCIELESVLSRAGDERILDTASSPQDETIMRLGPDLRTQLVRKVEIMFQHWRDYDRLFTEPNV